MNKTKLKWPHTNQTPATATPSTRCHPHSAEPTSTQSSQQRGVWWSMWKPTAEAEQSPSLGGTGTQSPGPADTPQPREFINKLRGV